MGRKGKLRPLLVYIIGAADIKTAAAGFGMTIMDGNDMTVIGYISRGLVCCKSIVREIRSLYRPRRSNRTVLLLPTARSEADTTPIAATRILGTGRHIEPLTSASAA